MKFPNMPMAQQQENQNTVQHAQQHVEEEEACGPIPIIQLEVRALCILLRAQLPPCILPLLSPVLQLC